MKQTVQLQTYHTHISSQRRWFDLNLKEVWRHTCQAGIFYNNILEHQIRQKYGLGARL